MLYIGQANGFGVGNYRIEYRTVHNLNLTLQGAHMNTIRSMFNIYLFRIRVRRILAHIDTGTCSLVAYCSFRVGTDRSHIRLYLQHTNSFNVQLIGQFSLILYLFMQVSVPEE